MNNTSSSFSAFFFHQSRNESQRGQIALIALLAMVVVLTVGISLASRSTLDVSLSRQEEQGSKTYQSAESGVEQALSTTDFDTISGDVTGSLDTGVSTVSYTVSPQLAAGVPVLEISDIVSEDSSVQVPLSFSSENAELTIQWHDGTDCTNAASILVRVYYSDDPDVPTSYWATNVGYDCAAGGHFGAAGSNTPNGSTYYRQIVLTLPQGARLASIRPVGANTKMRILGDAIGTAAVQWNITSKADNKTGSEAKAVRATRTVPMRPSFMDYVLYSGTSISKTN